MQYPLSQIIYFPLIDKHYVMWCVFLFNDPRLTYIWKQKKNNREEIAVIRFFLNSSSDNRTCCVKLINRKNIHTHARHVLIIKKKKEFFASINWTSAASIFSINKQIYIHHRDSDVIFLKLSTTTDRSYYYCVWYDPLD